MPSVLTSRRCLVLNKSWSPIGTIGLKRALIMLFSTHSNGEPKAKIIDPESFQQFTWEDWSKLRPSLTDAVIQSSNLAFKVPEVVLLTRYDKMPQPKIHFSRRTLYKRDNNTCQYCGIKPGTAELSVDHIIPKSKGGKTDWENVCLSCTDCNRKKGDKTMAQAKMSFFHAGYKPKKPRLDFFRFADSKPLKSWASFVSEAYWQVPLQNDME